MDKGKGKAVDAPKKVTFATPDDQGSDTTTPTTTKPEDSTTEKTPDPPIDGIIGQLELYRSGAVKMRLANGILLDVSLFQPSSHSRLDLEFIALSSGICCDTTFFPSTSSLHRQAEKETLCVWGGQQAIRHHPGH